MKNRRRRKKSPLSYQTRTYRRLVRSELVASTVKVMETDLHIQASRNVVEAGLVLVTELRRQLEEYIRDHPGLRYSLVPLPLDPGAPELVIDMQKAGLRCGVGPMAAVAGAIAERVGQGLRSQGIDEVIVENGGDLYLDRQEDVTVAVYAGESVLSGRVGLRIRADQMPCGVCCSSGTVGHSLSLGRADAVVAVAPSTALADAAATRLGNEVRPGDINPCMDLARKLPGVTGVVVVQDQLLGVWGDLELIRLEPEQSG